MGYLEDKLFQAVHNDDLSLVEKILSEDKTNINLKNDLGFTILHQCAISGSEKVFDFVFPQIKSTRLNMFDKHKVTPFGRAVTGPSDKIYYSLLESKEVEYFRCKAGEKYGGNYARRNEPIFSLVSYEKYKDRVQAYFDKDGTPGSWHNWYSNACCQGVLWAVQLVLDNGEFDKFAEYLKRSGLNGAITFQKTKIIELLYNYDNHIFEPADMCNSPLASGLGTSGRFAYLLSFLKTDLSTTKSGRNYDELINEIKKYKPDIAHEYFLMVMKLNIFISDKKIEEMMSNAFNDKTFFRSLVVRDDYGARILPMLHDKGVYEKYCPEEVQEIFMF